MLARPHAGQADRSCMTTFAARNLDARRADAPVASRRHRQEGSTGWISTTELDYDAHVTGCGDEGANRRVEEQLRDAGRCLWNDNR